MADEDARQMLRDLKKLFGLKDAYGVTFAKGQTIYAPGDVATDFYVVLKGRVRLERAGVTPAVINPGDFFGEIESFTGHPRRAGTTALDECTALAFNQRTTATLAETTPTFVVRLMQRCCERVVEAEDGKSPSPGPISPATTAQAAASPTAAVAPAKAAKAAKAAAPISGSAAPAVQTAAPANGAGDSFGPVLTVEHKEALWRKEVACPSCRTKFGPWNVRTNFINVGERDTDFMSSYAGVNPNWYAVWVCPNCNLAAYGDDFAAFQSADVARIKPALEALKGQGGPACDFTYYRDADLALRSFQLAIPSYQTKRGAEDKVAGLYQRMAWIERERGRTEQEKGYLAKAREFYEKAFSTSDAAKQGVAWSYLIGELSLRLEDFDKAVKWFNTAAQQPDFKAQPVLEKMTRDRWSEAGDLAKAAKAAASPS
ncbi:MAG: DUF2225 domain-containing protein [Chloroflexota bacterium]